jgi:basic membrane protein A
VTSRTRQVVLSGLALAGTVAVLAGCASAPSTTETAKKTDFRPCMVSDAGGFDDKSFNQLGYEGMKDAAKELGATYKEAESKDATVYDSNIEQLIGQNCNLVVTVGFNLADATKKQAAANPDTDFAIIDDNSIDAKNVKPITFDTSQAAFLAGYAAASYSADKDKKVGTFGGQNFPTVSIFMDGFKQGVEYWNAQKSDTIQVLGWDGTDGIFTDAFVPDPTAENAARGLIDQGADVILPVGGGIYLSAASVIRDSGKDVALLGVDADVYETDPSVADLLLTSVLKAIDVGVSTAIIEAGQGEFDAAPYIGVLEDDGVGIAPFHDFEDRVSPDLQAELDAIVAGIIDGSIPVTSYLAE